MPDLNIEIQFICSSNRFWETDVELTPGRKYKVTFCQQHSGDYQYDYQCECKAFKFGKGKPCKHIKHVSQTRCAWQGNSPVEKGGEYLAPSVVILPRQFEWLSKEKGTCEEDRGRY